MHEAFVDEPMDAYLAREAVSASLLGSMAKIPPAKAWDTIEERVEEQKKEPDPQERSAPKPGGKRFGTMVHDAILEPDSFASLYVIGPEGSWAKNPARALKNELQDLHPNATVIKPATYKRIMLIRDNVCTTNAYKLLFKEGVTEHSVQVDGAVLANAIDKWNARHAEDVEFSDGLALRMRPDHWTPFQNTDINLKTCANAWEPEFTWACDKLGHYLGCSLRRMIYDAAGIPCEMSVIIAAETGGRCEAQFYEVGQSTLDEHTDVALMRLNQFARWWKQGKPRPFTNHVIPLNMPEAAYSRIQRQLMAYRQDKQLGNPNPGVL